MSTSQQQPSLLNFIPPRLTKGKEWYVSFYCVYPATGKLRRVRIKLNRIKSLSQRNAVAKRLISEISVKQLSGWNYFVEAEAPKSYHFLFDVLDTFINVHEKELEKHSIRCYKSYVKILKNYLIKEGYTNQMYVSSFDRRIASDMMIEIKAGEYSLRTYNNYLQFFTSLFNWMHEFNYVSINPFSHIKKIPKKRLVKTRQTLTEVHRAQLKRFLLEKEGNNNYYVMCMLCYYCFLRPNEICQLKVKDIDLERQLVYVSEDIAKNDNDSYRTIPDVMMPYVKNLKLDCQPDQFLFSIDKQWEFVPGEKKAEGRDTAKYWAYIRKSLNWPMSLQFYSLKDTGITNMLADGVATNFVQEQADHSSLSMTSIYVAKKSSAAQEQIKKKASAF